MFATLSRLLQSASDITLIVTGNADEMTVTVIPKVTDAKVAAMKTPMSLTGSAAELDSGFTQALQSFVSVRKSLSEQIAETNAMLEAATKQEAAKAVKGASKVAPKAVSIDDLSSDDDTDPDTGLSDEGSDRDTNEHARSSSSPVKTQEEAGLDIASLL